MNLKIRILNNNGSHHHRHFPVSRVYHHRQAVHKAIAPYFKECSHSEFLRKY